MQSNNTREHECGKGRLENIQLVNVIIPVLSVGCEDEGRSIVYREFKHGGWFKTILVAHKYSRICFDTLVGYRQKNRGNYLIEQSILNRLGQLCQDRGGMETLNFNNVFLAITCDCWWFLGVLSLEYRWKNEHGTRQFFRNSRYHQNECVVYFYFCIFDFDFLI